MKKFVVIVCASLLGLGVAGCVGKGKAPVTPPPPMYTK
jgi:hypothetical protein